MNLKLRIWLLSCLFLVTLVARAEVAVNPGPGDDKEFRFDGYEINEQFVQLNYYLPYAGVVELRILTEDGEMVWQGQYLKERGEQITRLKTSAFEMGDTYIFQLNYKEDIFRKTLKIIP